MAGFLRAAALARAFPAGRDWMARAEAAAREVAGALRVRSGLDDNEWRDMPCLVGSSSHFIGAREERPDLELGPPVAFASQLARWFGVAGPVLAVNTACTSGLTALGLARDRIASGGWAHALVLGVELANRLSTQGFAALGLLTATQARPCDRDRDGLALGEALGGLIVSRAGGWRIAALASEIDPSGFTAPAPNEAVIAKAMRAALAAADWREVDLLKLQAGGSPAGDLAEARAVKSVFTKLPHLVSFKGEIGHTLGASGPAELALLLDALERGVVPPTAGFRRPDPALGLEPKAGDGSSVQRVLFNLAGFGGYVASLALERA